MNAHRAAFKLSFGYLPPKGVDLDHQCDTPLCVNPDHLKPMPHRENIRRSPKFNGNSTHCIKGHPFDADNTRTYVAKDGFVRRVCHACKKQAKERL